MSEVWVGGVWMRESVNLVVEGIRKKQDDDSAWKKRDQVDLAVR